MSSAQITLTGELYQHAEKGLDDYTEANWRELYERNGQCVEHVAQEVGHTWHAVQRRLVEFGIHDMNPSSQQQLLKTQPHEIGLSPLGCADCGQQEIFEHPCPDCGFDPRGGDD